MTKLENQKKYKEMLDEQIKFNKNTRMYGNMTQMEKRMNHYDLYAYKHKDKHQYSLIPGFNTMKMAPKSEMVKERKNNFDPLERLKKSGFSRDVRDVSPHLLTSIVERHELKHEEPSLS